MARFTIPRDVYYGPSAMDELKVLKGHKKAFIVTGTNFMIENGTLEKLEQPAYQYLLSRCREDAGI